MNSKCQGSNFVERVLIVSLKQSFIHYFSISILTLRLFGFLKLQLVTKSTSQFPFKRSCTVALTERNPEIASEIRAGKTERRATKRGTKDLKGSKLMCNIDQEKGFLGFFGLFFNS